MPKIREIRSKINNELLHYVITDMCLQTKDNGEERINVVDEKQFLQLSLLNMNSGKTFLPHKHLFKDFNEQIIAQESWVVLNGKVKVHFYDLDDSLIEEYTLNQFDVSVTLKGGHNYSILEDSTIVLEYKTGPYLGQKSDKVHI